MTTKKTPAELFATIAEEGEDDEAIEAIEKMSDAEVAAIAAKAGIDVAKEKAAILARAGAAADVAPIEGRRKRARPRSTWPMLAVAAAVLALGAAAAWRERADILGVGGPVAQRPSSTATPEATSPVDRHRYAPSLVGGSGGPPCAVFAWEGDVAYVLLSGVPTRGDLFTPDEPVCTHDYQPTVTIPLEAGGVDVAPLVGKHVDVKAVLTERDGNLTITIRHIEPVAPPP
jgi:hypothetical protein